MQRMKITDWDTGEVLSTNNSASSGTDGVPEKKKSTMVLDVDSNVVILLDRNNAC